MKYLTKIIEYGLYLLVFLLPIQTRWIIKAGETEYAAYSLYGTDILLVLLLLLFLFVIASDRQERSNLNNDVREIASSLTPLAMTIKNKSQILNYFIIGLLTISLISVIFAIDKTLAFYKLGWLVLGLGLFWLAASANYDRLKLLYASLAGIFLQAILAGWQFLTQSSFANKWLGLAFHNGADLGVSVIETVGADGVGERWLRSYGGFDHPNILGGVLATGILLLIGQIIITERVKNFQFSIFNFKIIILAFLMIFAAALFFSFSRAAWLALALGIGAMLIEAVMKKDYHAQKNILQAILISGSVFFVLFFQFSNLVITRVSGDERLEVKSVNERVESIKNSLSIIKNNYAAGAGIGNYIFALERLRPGQKSFYYQPAHNVFLLVWAEIGILGLIFFLGLIVYLIIAKLEIRNWKLDIEGNNYEINSSFNISILVSLMVLLSLDHWLWSLHFGVLFFWLILGVIVSNGRDKKLISV